MSAAVLKIADIKNNVTQVAKQYDVKKVTLFGSYANGNATKESDIDLLVEFSPKPKKPVTFFTIIGMKQEIEELAGKEVDIIKFPLARDSFLNIGKEVLLYAK